MDNTTKKSLLLYGSLRPGDYNYDRFKRIFGEDFEVAPETYKLPGFKMYDLGSYPGIKPSTTDNEIIVQKALCSKECHDIIVDMEVDAGYDTIIADLGEEKHPIFVYTEPVNESNVVLSGDWIQYQSEN
jgi:gamma-glutamylcyclotransferase (GGCT)/AIG2-like uncharacterized protein YtfP